MHSILFSPTKNAYAQPPCNAIGYILDPQEVHDEDFPGETLHMLKEKEIRLYGEYRTRRLVLEACDGRVKDELWLLIQA